MNLVVIEGAGKIKKISQILGKDYKVFATCGHITQLNQNINNGYGFEFEGPSAFIPKFQTLGCGTKDTKASVIKQLKKLASKADKIYIATDPDREGEGIAYHIYNQILDYKDKVCRITFNAINKPEIMKAIENPRQIDMNLVHAQFCRQVYDRYFGYKLSSFVKRVFQVKNSTAGRVQSAALLLLSLRENEIQNYVPRNWWTIEPKIQLDKNNIIKLKLVPNQKIEDVKFSSEQEAISFYQQLNDTYLFSQIIDGQEKVKKSNKPLTTSEILTIGTKTLKLSAKKTSQLLQRLYESGLITYPRSDSIRISPEFCEIGYQYALKHFGDQHADNSFWFNDIKQKDGVQDGHECIRVTELNNNSFEIVEQKLRNEKNLKELWTLYETIYKRTLQVFLKPAIFSQTTLIFTNNDYNFEYNFKSLVFDGFLKYTKNIDDEEDEENNEILELTYIKSLLNNQFKSLDLKAIIKHTDTCPTKYNIGDLIKKLEQLGIGRPSTFANMAEINIERENAILVDQKINVTQKGKKLNELIQKIMPELINLEFTANFEKELDIIAEGKEDWLNIVKKYINFYNDEIKKNNIYELRKEYCLDQPNNQDNNINLSKDNKKRTRR